MKKFEIYIINMLKCKGYLKFMKRCMWKKIVIYYKNFFIYLKN